MLFRSDSVIGQTYKNWELCIYDGGDKNTESGKRTEEIIQRYQKSCSNIFYQRGSENLGISGNTNEALKMAKGDYIAFMDHDDMLTMNAFYEVAHVIKEKGDMDLIYSDEDKMDMEGKMFFMPHFKPDFNLDLLRSVNYICHLLVVKRTLIEEVGGFQPRPGGRRPVQKTLEKDQCAYCKEKVHWAPECPKKGRAPKALTLEDDD